MFWTHASRTISTQKWFFILAFLLERIEQSSSSLVETSTMKNDKCWVVDGIFRSAAFVRDEGYSEEELDGSGAQTLHSKLALYTSKSEYYTLWLSASLPP